MVLGVDADGVGDGGESTGEEGVVVVVVQVQERNA